MMFFAKATAIVTNASRTMPGGSATGVLSSAIRRPHPFQKLLVALKFTAILLLITSLPAGAHGYAQGKITMRKTSASLEDVLLEINKQTGILYSANNETLQKAHPIDINVKNAELLQVLGICFANQPLTYALKENIIIVKEKATAVKVELTDSPNPIDVRGKVTDEKGNPVAGVTVAIKG